MTGVDFNANAGNTKNSIGNAPVSCVNVNNWAVINHRMQAEGPASDSFTPAKEKPKPDKDSLFVAAKNAVINLIKKPLGAKSSRIEFLEKPISGEKGTYILSEPFTSKNLEDAQAAAKKLFNIEQGRIERLTGENFIGISAQECENGHYVVVADGTLSGFMSNK